MLKAVFGIDPKLSDKFHIYMEHEPLHNDNLLFAYKNKRLSARIKFDTGDTYKLTSNPSHIDRIYQLIDIPKNATKITIISNNNIIKYISRWSDDVKSSIISIEDFTSYTITNCDEMFIGLENLKEVKKVNLRWDKITSARSMCFNWKSFNGKLPDNFCSNMTSLYYAEYMFSNWNSFNQELPKYFCKNMESLIHADYMFTNWISYSYKLPYHFFYEMRRNIAVTDYMFWNWLKCDKTPKYRLPKYLHDYKQKDADELNYLLEKHKEQITDYQLMSKLNNKNYLLCINGINIEHYIITNHGKAYCFYNYWNIYNTLYPLIKYNDMITIV